MIKRLLTLSVLILPLAVFGQNQYVGTFTGDGSGLTNVAVAATNAIANNSGFGTNLTVYGTLTSTNLNSLYDTNGAARAATNAFGNTVSVTMTNASNQITGVLNGNATSATSATTATTATNVVNVVVQGAGNQILQPWRYESCVLGSNLVYGFGNSQVITSATLPEGWTSYLSNTGTNLFCNGEYLPCPTGVRTEILCKTNFPFSGSNAPGIAVMVQGRISSATLAQGWGGGLVFGFATNASVTSVTIGGKYIPRYGLSTLSPSGNGTYDPSWFMPQTEMGFLCEIITNTMRLKAQGGFFTTLGCTLGSANWFEVYRSSNNVPQYWTNLAAEVGGYYYSNGIAISSIGLYTNWTDNESATLIDSEADSQQKVHVGSIMHDTNGNLLAEWELIGAGQGDSGTNITIEVSCRQPNGLWSPKTPVAGPNAVPGNTVNAARITMLNGVPIAVCQSTTSGFSNNTAVTTFYPLYVTNGVITVGSLQTFNITNLISVSSVFPNNATNYLTQSSIIKAPDGTTVMATIMVGTNAEGEGAECIRTSDGTNWGASILNTTSAYSYQEGNLFIMSDGNLGYIMHPSSAGPMGWQFSTNSGLTWSSVSNSPFSTVIQRPSVCQLPNNEVGIIGSDSVANRSMLCEWVCTVTATNGMIVQEKIPVYNTTNAFTVVYPDGLFHNGNLEFAWCDYYQGGNPCPTGFYYDSQPLDQSWRAAAANAQMQASASADKQAYSTPGTINAANLIGVLPQYPTVQIATNAPLTNAILMSPDGTNRYWATTLTGLTITNLVAEGPLTNDGDTSHSVLLVDGSGNPVFRGLFTTAWADSVNAQFFQIGPNSANVVMQTKTGLAAARFMLNAIATQFASCDYVGVSAPLSGSLVEFFNSQSNRVVIIQTNGTILSAGAVIATNGIASYATNSITVGSTGVTNTLGKTIVVNFTVGTGCSLFNNQGIAEFSSVAVGAGTQWRVQNNGWITGTAITATADAW